MKKIFSEEELSKIKESVKKAEIGNIGEIVPVFFVSSGKYKVASFRASLFFSFTISFFYYVLFGIFSDPFFIKIEFVFFLQMISGVFGYFLSDFFSPIKRFFTTNKERKKNVETCAYKCFVENEIFATNQRSGVLLFLSFFEKEVFILADKGIYNHIPKDSWTGITTNLVRDMNEKTKLLAIQNSIESISELFKQLPKELEIKNELKDDLRVGDVNV